GPGAVVLSYQFWQRELAGAADAVGRAVTVNDSPATIVGMLPRAFRGPGAVVLSSPFCQRELAGAADAVGRAVTVNDSPATIVGIMPRSFGGPSSRNNNDGWLPVGPGIGATSPVGCTARTYLWLRARLRPGATFEATAEQATVSSGIARIADATGKTGKRVALVSLDEQTTGDVRTSLL